jgi:hypothetical protein
VKTGKAFYRPMNHVVHAHLKSILPENLGLDEPVFLGGGARPNARFQELCALVGVRPTHYGVDRINRAANVSSAPGRYLGAAVRLLTGQRRSVSS